MKYAALLLLASQLLYASNPLLQPNNNQNIRNDAAYYRNEAFRAAGFGSASDVAAESRESDGMRRSATTPHADSPAEFVPIGSLQSVTARNRAKSGLNDSNLMTDPSCLAEIRFH